MTINVIICKSAAKTLSPNACARFCMRVVEPQNTVNDEISVPENINTIYESKI